MDGVIFDLKHSYDYYNAIMNYCRITPPEVKTNYIDIPGSDSSIDITESISGIRMSDGEINFKFTFLNGVEDARKMINDLHGKRKTITLDSDIRFEMDGRITITRAEIEKNYYVVEAVAKVKPYKTEKLLTIHEENVDGKKEIILNNTRKPVVPIITVEGNINLLFDNVKYKLINGTYQIPEITMYDGINRFIVYGNGKIRFEYKKGEIIC